MKSWHLWAGLALLVLLLLSVREGFAATATIKNPSSWDAAELTRIKAMVTPASTLPDTDIRRVVGGFWSVWDGATYRITLAEVTSYLNGVSGLGAKRNEYRDIIQAYYIQQGESVFTTASTYTPSTDSDTTTPPTPPADTASLEIERPTTSSQSLRQEIATTFGVPLGNSAAIDAVVTKVQSFYDTVYLPDKTLPTYTAIMGFADGVDTTTLPEAVKNNFKVHIVEVLQTYFAPPMGVSGATTPSSVTAGPAAGEAAGATGESGGWAGAAGKNVQGPDSGGRGSTDNTTGGLGIPRNYPVLYGGMQDFKSALPSSSSLGTDPTSKFLPYSRVPGDMDLYPDPYRLNKYFSTSSYSSGKDAPEPAPFLADFSKFFT
jgi:hypothetical protein